MMSGDEKAKFAERLNRACDHAGLPPLYRGRIKAIQDRFKVTPQAARKWINGESKPAAERIRELANWLGISRRWLEHNEGPMVDNGLAPANMPTQRVPLISWVSAGQMLESPDLWHPGDAENTVPSLKPVSNKAYALWVESDSMTNPHGKPNIPPGTIIVVDPELPADSNDVVVAKHLPTGTTTLKQYVQDGPHHLLKPANTQYDTIKMDDEYVILATFSHGFFF